MSANPLLIQFILTAFCFVVLKKCTINFEVKESLVSIFHLFKDTVMEWIFLNLAQFSMFKFA